MDIIQTFYDNLASQYDKLFFDTSLMVELLRKAERSA